MCEKPAPKERGFEEPLKNQYKSGSVVFESLSTFHDGSAKKKKKRQGYKKTFSPCECFYIRRTARRLKGGAAEHKSARRTNDVDYPAARYFHKCHNDNDSLVSVEGIGSIDPSVRGDRLSKLSQRETFWFLSVMLWFIHSFMKKQTWVMTWCVCFLVCVFSGVWHADAVCPGHTSPPLPSVALKKTQCRSKPGGVLLKVGCMILTLKYL